MASAPRLSSAGLRSLIVAGILGVLAIVMVVVGWTEEHFWQSVLLQLSWLVFDAAVFVIVWHLIRSRGLLPPHSERFRFCWLLMLGGILAGLLIYAAAYITKHAMLTPLGELCIAVGLGSMVCYLAATSLQRPGISNVEEIPQLDALMTSANHADAES